MLGVNRILAEKTLASHFNLMLTVVNSLGEEKERSIKMKRKDFLKQTEGLDLRVKLIDGYPEGEMQEDWLYINRNGKSAWLKEREE